MSSTKPDAVSDLEKRVIAEAKRCAEAMKLLIGSEVRFFPKLESAAELGLFLVELSTQCRELGVQSLVAFTFYPTEFAEPSAKNSPRCGWSIRTLGVSALKKISVMTNFRFMVPSLPIPRIEGLRTFVL